jgi:hypothetical protein
MRKIVQTYICKAKLSVEKASNSRVVFVALEPNHSPDVTVTGHNGQVWRAKTINVQLFVHQLPDLIKILQKVVAVADKDGTLD